VTKLYLTCVTFVLFTLATFGIVLPFLFSAASTELVGLGIAALITYPVVAYQFVKNIEKQLKKVSK